MSKFKWLLALLCAFSMIAAACGSDADDVVEAADDAAETVEDDAEEAPEDAAAADEAPEDEAETASADDSCGANTSGRDIRFR